VRVLLASIECDTTDVEANLSRHVALLERARQERCDLAVFPEFSLTGSVDPLSHPERAVSLEGEVVRRLVAATGRLGVPALFGIAERSADTFSITQVHAWAGRILGLQRKRHLGPDEVGYTADGESTLFELGAFRFAAVICAEAEVDFTWDAAVSAGAHAVFLCSAPGLYGRRESAAAWRSGFTWWEQRGLGAARAQAQRCGLWVGMATQAGSTSDEDFPGLGALVSPAGEVVDRLPDRHPGVVVGEIPGGIEVEPVRWSVRVLVLDDSGRALLAQFGDDRGARWWVPPGGGIEAGEDDIAAAERELFEELGRDDLTIGPPLGQRCATFLLRQGWITQNERWYLCRCRPFDVGATVIEAVRAEGILRLQWWSSSQIRAAGIRTGPVDLADLIDAILAGRPPVPDADLGF